MINFNFFKEYIIKKLKSFETEDDIIEITERLSKITYINGVQNVINYLTNKKREIENDIRLNLLLRNNKSYDTKFKTKQSYDANCDNIFKYIC